MGGGRRRGQNGPEVKWRGKRRLMSKQDDMEHKPGKIRRALEWLAERMELERLLRVFSGAFIYGALDERLSFREALEQALKRPIPPFVNGWFCFGGLTFLFFVNQVITGILLAFYYQPTEAGAYGSIVTIMNSVPLGWLVRQAHAWGGNLLILCLFVHFWRVVLHRAFRAPREFNWVVGFLLLVAALTFAFTGYLLPWDESAYWGTVAATGIIGHLPLVGKPMLHFVRGGELVNGITLLRFYALHVVVLPWIITYLLLAHFAMVRRQGIAEPL